MHPVGFESTASPSPVFMRKEVLFELEFINKTFLYVSNFCCMKNLQIIVKKKKA